uniref:Caffeoyl-CoA O-methyltransferase n=1 Tax=Setaria italica TaxID=4555 RepID=K3YJA6_SETIT
MSPRLAAALPLPPPLAPAAAATRRLGVLRPLSEPSAATPAAASCSPRRRGAVACLVRLLCSHHSAAAAVEEARRGRKQLGMTPPLYDYLLANVREHPVLRELREETAAMRGSQMQVSPAQAQLLAMLVQILGAQRCIEVGVFTIDVKHALAADSLRSLLDCGEASSYDFAFVDADKRMYEEYFELLLKLVRVGGLIVMDNVLWYGRVADPLVDDRKTISIRNFNKKVLEDKRVDISMVPIGDGMTICRKLVDT